MVINRFFHKLVDLFRNFLSCVEKSLLLVILPVQSEIKYSYGLPEIAQLGASTIDYSSYLISNNELKILKK